MPSISKSAIQIGRPLIKEHQKTITLSTSSVPKQRHKQEI
jgi:hypothetical protein